jgi:prophage antirepressor-like protein
MNNIVEYTYLNKNIRTITDKENKIWFVVNDICNILELQNSSAVINKLKKKFKEILISEGDTFKCDPLNDTFSTYPVETGGGLQQVNIISEAGLNLLIMQSRKPDVFKFQYWIANDVLPSIRKTGSYSINQIDNNSILTLINNHNQIIESVVNLQTEIVEIKNYIFNLNTKTPVLLNNEIKTFNLSEVAKQFNFRKSIIIAILRYLNVITDYSPYQLKEEYSNSEYFINIHNTINFTKKGIVLFKENLDNIKNIVNQIS